MPPTHTEWLLTTNVLKKWKTRTRIHLRKHLQINYHPATEQSSYDMLIIHQVWSIDFCVMKQDCFMSDDNYTMVFIDIIHICHSSISSLVSESIWHGSSTQKQLNKKGILTKLKETGTFSLLWLMNDWQVWVDSSYRVWVWLNKVGGN